MKNQPCTPAPRVHYYNNNSLMFLLAFATFLSCINWDDLNDGPPANEDCNQNLSLFSGTYQVSSICDAYWGSSNYVITVFSENSHGNCEWTIQNILNTGKDVSGIYESSTSAIKIYSQNFVEYWQISGDLTRNGNEINVDLRLISNVLDSTIICTISGIKK